MLPSTAGRLQSQRRGGWRGEGGGGASQVERARMKVDTFSEKGYRPVSESQRGEGGVHSSNGYWS